MTQPRIFFVGASTVEGMGDETRLGWPGRLLAIEGARLAETAAYNLGVRGQTTVEISRRWQDEVKTRMPVAGPTLVVQSAGINDTAYLDGDLRRVPLRKTLALASAMAEAARDFANLLWVGPFPIDESRMPYSAAGGRMMDFRNSRVEKLNRELAALAGDLSIPYVDLFSPLSAAADWPPVFSSADGLHPHGQGYQRIAEIISSFQGWRNALDRLLNEPAGN